MAIADDNEGDYRDEMEALEGVLSGEVSLHSSGPPSLYCETVRTNGSCSKERSDDSSWDSEDDIRDGQLWGWDPLEEIGINPDEHDEIIAALRSVARSKFEHGKRWGCNRKQRNLKRRWEICQEAVVRRHMTMCQGKESVRQMKSQMDM